MSLGRRGGAGCEARMLLGTSRAEMGDGGDPRANKSHPGGGLETLWGEGSSLGKESRVVGTFWDASPGGTGKQRCESRQRGEAGGEAVSDPLPQGTANKDPSLTGGAVPGTGGPSSTP